MKTIGRIIYWRHKRGSWQYDILCALILGFIFLTPHELFDGSYFTSIKPVELEEEKKVDDRVLKEQDNQGTHLAREPVDRQRKGR